MFKLCQFNYQAWLNLTSKATAVMVKTKSQQIKKTQLTTWKH